MKQIKGLTRSIRENKIASLLLLTTLLGAVSTLIEFPAERVVHWNGEPGDYKSWDFFFQFKYFIGFAFVLALLVKERTWIDTQVIWCYLICDFIGFLIYKYQGYPEPKAFIIGVFFITLIIFFSLEVWRRMR